MNEKVKKINWLYAIGLPTLFALLIVLGLTMEVYLFLVGIAAIFIFMFVHQIIFKSTCKKVKKMTESLTPDAVFYAQRSMFVLDRANNKLLLTFSWNPCKIYELTLTNVTSAITRDFKSGSGIFEGTMQVGFQFIVNDSKVLIITFSSRRQKFAMDSKEVLVGISKADSMVELLTKHL